MKNHILSSILLTICCVGFFCGVYTVAVWSVAQFAANNGKGEIIKYSVTGERYGFANVGQTFTADKYFWSRPSAVGYNAAGSAGSNKGPSNSDYLAQVQARIDTFMIHNPSIKKDQITADLVTASGSGLDPDISIASARIQIARIAHIRNISQEKLEALVSEHTQNPLMGMFGPASVNVLQLNVALDNLK
ncbi:MAG TPA: K(+)-transporting ATPase subunit C [Cyclobacteriaceae bacterium]